MNGTALLKDVMSAVHKFLCKVHGTKDDHNYSPMPHILFQSEEEQANVSGQEVTNLLWTLLEELKDISDSANIFPKKIKYWMDQQRPTCDVSIQTDAHREMSDNKFVQITCDNTEFNRRIDAFMKRKRAESDAFNRREFCSVTTKPNETSCARTNAIYVPRQTRNSLLEIENVRNIAKSKEKMNPKIEEMKVWPPTHPSSTLPFNKLPSDFRERITNLNSVLFYNKGITEHTDMYAKIKDLETRVLYLESLSPEYFDEQGKNIMENSDLIANSHGEIIEQVSSPEKNKQDNMLLDRRIKELQEKLERKAKELALNNKAEES